MLCLWAIAPLESDRDGAVSLHYGKGHLGSLGPQGDILAMESCRRIIVMTQL